MAPLSPCSLSSPTMLSISPATATTKRILVITATGPTVCHAARISHTERFTAEHAKRSSQLATQGETGTQLQSRTRTGYTQSNLQTKPTLVTRRHSGTVSRSNRDGWSTNHQLCRRNSCSMLWLFPSQPRTSDLYCTASVYTSFSRKQHFATVPLKIVGAVET